MRHSAMTMLLEQVSRASMNGPRWCMEPAWLMRRRNIAFVFGDVAVDVVAVDVVDVAVDDFNVGQNSTRPGFWSIFERAELRMNQI